MFSRSPMHSSLPFFTCQSSMGTAQKSLPTQVLSPVLKSAVKEVWLKTEQEYEPARRRIAKKVIKICFFMMASSECFMAKIEITDPN